MKVAIVGGGLQGIETAYLARQAGWRITLLDREPAPPARGLCDRFIQTDVTSDDKARAVFAGSDLILPALENPDALNALDEMARNCSTPLAYDSRAYAVTSSKYHSNCLFEELGLALPPDGNGDLWPVIVKPSQGSGSCGVKMFDSYLKAQSYMSENKTDGRWICQKYLPGPSYSIEVVGMPGDYQTMAVTDLFMDEAHDCKQVRAPSRLAARHKAAMAQMAQKLAQSLSLKGIMDVEAILHDDRLYLLEIDARIPSQTPTAVYKATGINMVAMVGAVYTQGNVLAIRTADRRGGVIYEHIRVDPEGIQSCGEHIMAQAGPLELVPGFFGCDEAITNFRQESDNWVATLICSGKDPSNAWSKRCAAVDRIRASLKEASLTGGMVGAYV